jgi:glyoxylase-like metal-dependent hydrolase (beta-lactamase superfamily II)
MSVNCVILHDDREALIVDPGFEPDRIVAFLERNKLTPIKILATHGHFDHIGYVEELKNKYKIPFYLHQGDENYLKMVEYSAAYFGISDTGRSDTTAEGWLTDKQDIAFGDSTVKVLHTPGHSAGSVGLYIEKHGVLLSGDTLFRDAIGRTDLGNSDPALIAPSIQNRFYTLPDDTTVIPGHGASTTIGYEKVNNMYVRG